MVNVILPGKKQRTLKLLPFIFSFAKKITDNWGILNQLVYVHTCITSLIPDKSHVKFIERLKAARDKNIQEIACTIPITAFST